MILSRQAAPSVPEGETKIKYEPYHQAREPCIGRFALVSPSGTEGAAC